RPGQVLRREDLLLQLVADGVGGPVDVRHRRHRGEVELLLADAGADVALGLDQVLGVSGEAAGHGKDRKGSCLTFGPGAGCPGTPSRRRARWTAPPRSRWAGRRTPPGRR